MNENWLDTMTIENAIKLQSMGYDVVCGDGEVICVSKPQPQDTICK